MWTARVGGHRLKMRHDDIVVLHPRTSSGFTAAGIYAEHDHRLPLVYGRVAAAHPALSFERGQLVMFAKDTAEEHVVGNERVYLINATEVATELELIS